MIPNYMKIESQILLLCMQSAPCFRSTEERSTNKEVITTVRQSLSVVIHDVTMQLDTNLEAIVGLIFCVFTLLFWKPVCMVFKDYYRCNNYNIIMIIIINIK